MTLISALSICFAVIFVMAGTPKLFQPRTRGEALRPFLPPWAGAIPVSVSSLLLGFVEVAAGVGLVVGSGNFKLAFSVAILALLIGFHFAIRKAIKLERPCGCFGSGLSKPAQGSDLARNLILIGAAAGLVAAELFGTGQAVRLTVGSGLLAAAALTAMMLWSLPRPNSSDDSVALQRQAFDPGRRSLLRGGLGALGGIGLFPHLAAIAGAEDLPSGPDSRLRATELLPDARVSSLVQQAGADEELIRLREELRAETRELDWASAWGIFVSLQTAGTLAQPPKELWSGEVLGVPFVNAGAGETVFWTPDGDRLDKTSLALAVFPVEHRLVLSSGAPTPEIGPGLWELFEGLLPPSTNGDPFKDMRDLARDLGVDPDDPPEPPDPPCDDDRCWHCEADCDSCIANARIACSGMGVAAVACCVASWGVGCGFCTAAAIAGCASAKLACSDVCDCAEECANC